LGANASATALRGFLLRMKTDVDAELAFVHSIYAQNELLKLILIALSAEYRA